jgi:hypothetical protein
MALTLPRSAPGPTLRRPGGSMSDAQNRKPSPARPPRSESGEGAGKPTPARALVGTEPRESPSPEPPARKAAPTHDPDVPEVTLAADGTTWRIRVLGRGGRASDRSPPLLMLGFWEAADRGLEHDREATVVARRLADLAPAHLLDALAGSSRPPPPDRKRAFFEGASQGRRGGTSRRDS